MPTSKSTIAVKLAVSFVVKQSWLSLSKGIQETALHEIEAISRLGG
jgi:hypothetical protein